MESATAPKTVAMPVAQEEPKAEPVNADDLINMMEPLVWQIQKLNKSQYIDWVHRIHYYKPESGMKQARLFQSNFLESLSYTKWWVVPLVWVPVSLFLWSQFVLHPDASLGMGVFCFAFGVAVWTLLEYCIHRFVFHVETRLADNPWMLMGHFLAHGIHHKVPADPYRLVMPPTLAAILQIGIYALTRSLLAFVPTHVYCAMYGSGMLGYLAYDMTHYSQHHARFAEGSYMRGMQKYHMKHHYADGLNSVGFGITSKFWDALFGTMITPEMYENKTAL